jgi:hypothetical protein
MGKTSDARRLLTNGLRQSHDTSRERPCGHAHNSCPSASAPAARGKFYEGAPYEILITDFTLYWVRTSQSSSEPIDLAAYSAAWADYMIETFVRYPYQREFHLVTDQSLGTEAKKLAQSIRKAAQDAPRLTREDLDLIRKTHVVHLPKSCYVTKSPNPEEDARTVVLSIIVEYLKRELVQKAEKIMSLPPLDTPRMVYLDGFEHHSLNGGRLTRFCVEFGKEPRHMHTLLHGGEADVRLNAIVADALLRGFRSLAIDSYDTDALDSVAQLDFYMNSPHVPEDDPVKKRLRRAVRNPSTTAFEWRHHTARKPDEGPVLVWSFAPVFPHLDPLEELSEAMWPAAYTHSHVNVELLLAQMYTTRGSAPEAPSPVLSLLLLLNLCGCDYVMTTEHGEVFSGDGICYLWREYKHNLALLDAIQQRCDAEEFTMEGLGLMTAAEADRDGALFKPVRSLAAVVWNADGTYSMRANMTRLRDLIMCTPGPPVGEHLLRAAVWATFYYCVYPTRFTYFIEECAPPCAAEGEASVFGFAKTPDGDVRYAKCLTPAAVREFADLNLHFGRPLTIYVD